jgi:enamine deaminase RidA (YjgF/YER057c/UK114 family)
MVKAINPLSLGKPVGYSHGMQAGKLLFVAGQVGAKADKDGALRIAAPDFAGQFEVALDNVLEVVRAAKGKPSGIVEMTIFVTDLAAYRAARGSIGRIWKLKMGKHYPAMTLVEVSDLLEAHCLLEIRAVASLE